VSRWPTVEFGEVMTPNRRPYLLGDDEDANLVGMRLYAHGPFHRELKPAGQIRKKSHFVIREGDVIYNKLFAWKGTFGIVPPELDGMFVSDKFPTYALDDSRVDPSYLRWYFRYPEIWEQARRLSTGSAALSKLTLNPPKFIELTMPLPPIEEQRRVAEKLNRLQQRMTHARRDAHLVDKQVGVLATAEVGRMIECVAGTHEPLGDLLAEPSRNGLSTRPSDTPPGVPILRISAATSRADAVVDEADVKYLPLSRLDADAYWLQPGDLLACRFNGNLGYVGRFSRYVGLSKESRVYPDKLIRFRVDATRVRPEFVCLAMNSRYGREQIERFCQTTAGNIGISARNLKTVGVPTPSLDVQSAMIRRALLLQELVTAVRTRRAQVATTLDAVMPAVMSEFWG